MIANKLLEEAVLASDPVVLKSFLLDGMSCDFEAELARYAKTPDVVLSILAKSAEEKTLIAVSAHPNVSASTVEALLARKELNAELRANIYRFVRLVPREMPNEPIFANRLIQNLHIDIEILRRTYLGHEWHRAFTMSGRNLPADQMNEIIHCHDCYVVDKKTESNILNLVSLGNDLTAEQIDVILSKASEKLVGVDFIENLICHASFNVAHAMKAIQLTEASKRRYFYCLIKEEKTNKWPLALMYNLEQAFTIL